MAQKTTPSDNGEGFGLPPAATLKRLKISREVAWYMVTRGFDFPKHPPLFKTPEPGEVDPDAVFDPVKVDNVVRAQRALRHTQGVLAGQPLNPDPWQVAYLIAPVFGWVKPNSAGRMVRVARTLYVEVPRKNGKSTTAGGLGLYMTGADGEQGAQVVAAASTKEQASFVFAPIKKLAESTPALKAHFRPLSGKVIHPRSNSYFGVIASSADAQHGANLHCAVIDELHVHKTPDLVDALETGTGSREQPLVIFITTADSGKPNTIYARKRRYIEQLTRRVFTDPGTYGVIFAIPQEANPLDPRNWPKANPGYPISPTHEYLESRARQARNSPAELASFKRLHMGQRTKQQTAFIRLEDWDANAGRPITTYELEGKTAFGGLDLAAVSDLTALCWLFPYKGKPGYDAIWRFWCPEDNLDDLNKRTADEASVWVADGWITLTPGNVTDYTYVFNQLIEDMGTFNVQSVGFDVWAAQLLANQLLEHGVPIVQTRQGTKTLGPALKEAQRLVLMGKKDKTPRIHHGGNPVMRWMTDNLAVLLDANNNPMPDKKNSADKIDGWSALLNAIVESVNTDEKSSAYNEDDGLTVA